MISGGRFSAWRCASLPALLVLVCAPAFAATPAIRYKPQVLNADLVGGRLVETGQSPVFLLWGSDATILRSENGRDWQHADSAGAADLTQVAADTQGAVLVAVGARGAILKSVDAGKTWTPARNPTVDTDLQAVVGAGNRIWIAAGTGGRILRSTDDAKSWKLIDSKLKATMRTLHLDARSGRVMIGGDDGLVGFSSDRGESWHLTAITMPDPVTPISGFHRFDKLLLATSALGRFLTSEDDGDSWDLMQSSSQAFYTDAAYDADHGVIVMTGHNGDVLRSPDGGRSWEGGEVVLDGRKNFLSAIRHDPRTRSLLVAGQGGTMARSTDGGASWSRASSDLSGELRGLLRDPRGPFIVFGAGGLVASSMDSGTRWQVAREGLDYPLREILLTPQGNALIATSRLGDVLRSTDAGRSWRVVTPRYPDPHTPPDLRGLIVAPMRNAVIALGPPGAILRAGADGLDWQVAVWNDIAAERAFLWVLADEKRGQLVAVEARGGMMVSDSQGSNWRRSDLPVSLEPGKLPFWHGTVLASRDLMLVAGEAGRAARSRDGGASWQVLDTGSGENLYGSYADEATGTLFLAGSKGTLLRSADLGSTWTGVATGSAQELRRLWRDPRTRSLLCFGAHGTLLRSQDDGRTWRAATSGTDGVLRKIIAEPASNHLLLVGGQGALLRSADGGRNWEKLDTHSLRHFSSIAADKQSGDLVLVGERIVRLVRQSAAKE
jgi:photosystem II stability/assembly factor-like uncharacterized protein